MNTQNTQPNLAQRQAIQQTEGHVLIIAGPGTGKTRTLVERVIHLIADCHVDPAQIAVTTFTHRAADELLKRVLDALDSAGRTVDPGSLTVGNFHQLGRQILALYPETSPWRPGARTLDVLARDAMLVRLVPRLRTLPWAVSFVPQLRGELVAAARSVGLFFDRLREGFYDLTQEDEATRQARGLLRLYRHFLLHNNVLDYSEILYAACERLEEDAAVREAAQARCRYLMVDEYQDTNRLQERMIRLLSAKSGNLCVVGDDDQSLYRFRGATVDNLLGFTSRYDDVHVIRLSENYRSDGKILDTATRKLEEEVSALDSDQPLRLDKALTPANPAHVHDQAVQRLYVEDVAQWAKRVTETIVTLHEQGVAYHDMALLSHSVQPVDERVLLYRALREAHVPLGMSHIANIMRTTSAERLVALLYLALEKPVQVAVSLGWIDPKSLSRVQKTAAALPIRGREVREAALRELQSALAGGETLSFQTLCHVLLGVPPLKDVALEALADKATAREPFEALVFLVNTLDALLRETPTEDPLQTTDASVFHGDMTHEAAALFGWAIPYLEAKSPRPTSEMPQWEDNTLPVMTIHQSKGLEFSVVILLETPLRKPWGRNAARETLLTPATSGVVDDTVAAVMDHARLHYTARTRAKTLLVETAVRHGFDDPAPRDEVLRSLSYPRHPRTPAVRRISYTADIALYATCPRQFYFVREAGLTSAPTRAAARGTLLHETLALVHERLVKTQEPLSLEAGQALLQRVYGGMRAAHAPLDPEDGRSAWTALSRYLSEMPWTAWGGVRAAEVAVQVARGEALLEGTLDLVGTEGAIVDFKTGHATPEKARQYRGQLALYRELLASRTGEAKAANILYYMDEGRMEEVTFTAQQQRAFDDAMQHVIGGILTGDVTEMTQDATRCAHCVAQWICGRHETPPSKERT